MDSQRWQDVHPIAEAAIELADEERGPYLDHACRGDTDLRRQVEQLLADDASAGSFLERPAIAALPDVSAAGDRPRSIAGPASGPGDHSPSRIGPYRLLRVLQRGGMGTVFLAQRDDDEFTRQVAVKVLRQDYPSEDARRRLLVERQILARLEHPNITRLYDGGSTEAGQPFLVMEYVEGRPLDAYCAGNGLTVDQRLDLFMDIGRAVHFAHQNLLVHRDLKPANILVTPDGVAKLLDFGIAKPLEPMAGADFIATRTGSRPMTPGYASPEQILGQPVTTATDVHALGVLLYELLTGCRPFGTPGLSLHLVERAICETDPVRPSEAVAGKAAIRVQAAADGANPDGRPLCPPGSRRELRRRLSGDLDTIILKALRKDPVDRYASVEQLCDDLRRHRQGWPVEARRKTFFYRAGKFLARYRIAAVLCALFLLLLSGYFVNFAVHAERVDRERDKAERVLDFVVELFEVSSPGEEVGGSVTARQLLDLGAYRAFQDLDASPEVQAAILNTLGSVYVSLGLYDQAQNFVEEGLARRRQELGDEHPDVAQSLDSLALVFFGQGDFERAEGLFREALALRRETLGADHPRVADTLYYLAHLLIRREQLDDGEAMLRQVIEIQRRTSSSPSRRLAASLGGLARALYLKSQVEAAQPLAEEALAMERQVLGEGHPRLAVSLEHLGSVYVLKRRFTEAEPLFREALALRRRYLGEEHPVVSDSVANLGWFFSQQRNYRTAASFYRQSLDIERSLNTGDHPDVAMILSNMGHVLGKSGDLAGAEEYFRQCLEMRLRLVDPDHPHIAHVHYLWAMAQHDNGKLKEAEGHYRKAMAGVADLPPGHPAAAYPKAGLGRLLTDLGQARAGEPLLREALKTMRTTHSEDHWRIANTASDLGAALLAQGGYEEAEPLLQKGYDTLQAWFDPEDPEVTRAHARLKNLAASRRVRHAAGPNR